MDWQRHPRTLTREVPGGWLTLSPTASEPVLLSGSAADLWVLLASPIGRDALVDALATHYRGDPDRIGRDVDAALADLETHGLICAGPA